MDPTQVVQVLQQVTSTVLELGKAISPMVQLFGPVAGQLGSDAMLKGLRAVSGIDGQLKELAAQQRANAEADAATLERVTAVEGHLRELADELRSHNASRASSAVRLAAVEDAMRALSSACSVKHANGG